MESSEELNQRAQEFAASRGIVLMQRAGAGVNGTVWYTNRGSVIKVFERLLHFERERDAYLRLSSLEVSHINEFSVPRLLDFDEDLCVVEMGCVSPPFVLDFAGAYLDHAPEFSPEVLAEQEARNAGLFGQRWPRVRLLLAKLRSMGIHYIDINRGNIRFPEFDDEAKLSESSPPV